MGPTEKNFQCGGQMDFTEGNCRCVMVDKHRKTASVMECLFFEDQGCDLPFLEEEEEKYILDMDIGVEPKLMDCSDCTICTCQIYCDNRDHQRWLFGIAYRKICHFP